MTRLQKKCFIGSMATHGLLVAIMFIAPGFLSKRETEPPPPLTFIPGKVVDSVLTGGGRPDGSPPPPAVAKSEPVTPLPPPTPKVAAPQKVEPAPPPPPKPVPAPEPPQVVVKDALIPEPVKKNKPVKIAETEPPPKKNQAKNSKSTEKPKIDLSKVVTRKTSDVRRDNDDKKAKTQDESETRATAATQARIAALSGARNSLQSLRNNLSGPISVEPLGPGGEPFANYGQVVVSIYQSAWLIPDDVSDDSAVVLATVTIARDGTVLSASILQRSGRSAVDKSVQRTLDKVKRFPEFPEGAKDMQRTFNINFNLKAKRLLG